jgi:hypothetical protein
MYYVKKLFCISCDSLMYRHLHALYDGGVNTQRLIAWHRGTMCSIFKADVEASI